MKIAGIQKVSFIDYPGRISSVLFCPYCNLRCPFCHNPELVFFKGDFVQEDEILTFLQSKTGKIKSVVITGGEPTLQADLAFFAQAIKDLGFLLKLDTNGHNPTILEQVIDIFDCIAMDIKAPCPKYKTFGGNCKALKESLEVLNSYKGRLILRTTLYPPFTSKEDLEEMESIIPKELHFERQLNPYREGKILEKFLEHSN